MLSCLNRLTSIYRTQAVAGLIASAALMSGTASAVHAGVTYDVRFSDGSSLKDLSTSSGPFTIDLYAIVTGVNGVNDEMLQTNYVVLQSNEINGGVFNGTLINGTLTPTFAGSGSRPGSGSDLNADGVGDWSSTSTDGTDTAYMLARASSLVNGTPINSQASEFKLASWTLQVDSLVANPSLGAETRIAIVQPSFTTGGLGPAAYTTYNQDGNSLLVTTGDTAGVYGDFVTITVPEPSTLAVLCLGGAMLIARRRNAR